MEIDRERERGREIEVERERERSMHRTDKHRFEDDPMRE